MENLYVRKYGKGNNVITVNKANDTIQFYNLSTGYIKIILNQKIESCFKKCFFPFAKRKKDTYNSSSMVKKTNKKEITHLFFSYLDTLSSHSLLEEEKNRIFKECVLPEITHCNNFQFASYFNPKDGGETGTVTYIFNF